MDALELMYEGKAKQVWSTRDPSKVIMRFKNDATAFNGVKKASVEGKGAMNCKLSAHLFKQVANKGVQHHMVQVLNETDMLCDKVEIIPVEVVVRNIVAGSMARRYGLEEGTHLPRPLVEFFYKSDELDDPLMGRDVAVILGWAKDWELSCMAEQALEINATLKMFWGALGIELVDAKYEFGRQNGRILLADELTPDGARLWERGTGRHLDKDVFRKDLGDLGETYRELHARVFGA